MSFQEKLEKFEQSQGTTTTEEVIAPVTVSVTDPVIDPVVPVVTNEPAPEVATPEPLKNTVIPEVVAPDYNKFLEESSGGLFKDVDTFKESLTKITGYDDLQKQNVELQAKLEVNPFANDFVKTYNDLVKAGKTSDQIDSFVNINKLGDLSQLDPFQLKVEKLVQDGFKREVAERKVTRDFGLNIETEGDHLSDEQIAQNKLDLEDANEALRISAIQEDLPALQKLKIELSNTADNDANNKALAEQSQLKEYNDKLAPIVGKITEQYTGLGSINVNGKSGEEAKLMTFDIDPEFKAEAHGRLLEYFKDGKTPVNDQTVAEAKEYLDAVWMSRNREKFAQINYNQGLADAKLAVTAEFENPKGVPTSGLAPVTQATVDAVRDQQRKAARGED